jgi:hypothetical protein
MGPQAPQEQLELQVMMGLLDRQVLLALLEPMELLEPQVLLEIREQQD